MHFFIAIPRLASTETDRQDQKTNADGMSHKSTSLKGPIKNVGWH